jgi:hypothetical protein
MWSGYVIPKRLKSCFPFLAICSDFDFRVGFVLQLVETSIWLWLSMQRQRP